MFNLQTSKHKQNLSFLQAFPRAQKVFMFCLSFQLCIVWYDELHQPPCSRTSKFEFDYPVKLSIA